MLGVEANIKKNSRKYHVLHNIFRRKNEYNANNISIKSIIEIVRLNDVRSIWGDCICDDDCRDVCGVHDGGRRDDGIRDGGRRDGCGIHGGGHRDGCVRGGGRRGACPVRVHKTPVE